MAAQAAPSPLLPGSSSSPELCLVALDLKQFPLTKNRWYIKNDATYIFMVRSFRMEVWFYWDYDSRLILFNSQPIWQRMQSGYISPLQGDFGVCICGFNCRAQGFTRKPVPHVCVLSKENNGQLKTKTKTAKLIIIPIQCYPTQLSFASWK